MEMEKKILFTVAILAAVAMATCVPLLNEGQDADSAMHVGDEVIVSIPTEECKDVRSGLIQFDYDADVLRFIDGVWNIDALIKDVSDGEGVFAIAGSATIPSKDNFLELRFECLAAGQASVDAKYTFKTSSGDIVETVDPIVLNISCDHELVEHPATPATVEKEGNTLYYSCSKCGKYYSDAGGLIEIEEGSWIIPKVDPGSGATVTFVLAKGISEEIDVRVGETVDPIEDPELNGVDFIGWFLKDSDTVFDFTKPIAGDTILYAHFGEKATTTEQAQKVVAVMSKDMTAVVTAYDGKVIGKGTMNVSVYQLISIFGMQAYVEVGAFQKIVSANNACFKADVSEDVGKRASDNGTYAVKAEIVLENGVKRLTNYVTFEVGGGS